MKHYTKNNYTNNKGLIQEVTIYITSETDRDPQKLKLMIDKENELIEKIEAVLNEYGLKFVLPF
jgi:hypothetical protein